MLQPQLAALVPFVASLGRVEIEWVVVALLVTCPGALVGSLVAFIQGVDVLLGAVRVEIGPQ
jgi:hypothetical protein